jgi:hypothetical protein
MLCRTCCLNFQDRSNRHSQFPKNSDNQILSYMASDPTRQNRSVLTAPTSDGPTQETGYKDQGERRVNQVPSSTGTLPIILNLSVTFLSLSTSVLRWYLQTGKYHLNLKSELLAIYNHVLISCEITANYMNSCNFY